MRFIHKLIALGGLVSAFSLQPSAFSQGTAFTYQGRLSSGGAAAGGIYDLRFTIYDSTNNPGVVIAGPLTNSATGVSNGLFAATLDFGAGVFTGPPRWLELAVRTNGGGAFTALAPRQPLTPSPYAIFANTASNLSGALPAANLGGTYSNAVNFNNGANNFNGTFVGQFFGSIFTGGIFTGSFLGSGAGLYDVWHTGGNLGTTPGVNFLGTTDNQALEMRVNNQRVLRLEPATDLTGFLPNVIGGKDNYVVPGTTGAFIGGGGGVGLSNTIASTESVIAGGFLNHIEAGNAHASVIGGGFDNTIMDGASRSVIAGGHANRIGTNAIGSVVGGGEINYVLSNSVLATVSGGYLNTAAWNFATVGGGFGNYASGNFNGNGDSATVAGGYLNSSLGNNAFVGGGYVNYARGDNSVIAGGWFNTNHSSVASIGGGFLNLIQLNSSQSLIAGGNGNTIQSNAPGSIIGGGSINLIQSGASGAIIAGGFANTNAAANAVMGGGVLNVIQPAAGQSVIGGGSKNLIRPSASHSTIPGGYGNVVVGSNSFAAGSFAQANDNGTFVWSDNSSSNYFSSTGSNQFQVRADGGLFFSHGPAGVSLDQFNLNSGDLNHGLKFGLASGEGIASKRTSGGNQYGLDFYTLFINRMSISQNGTVTIPGLVNAGSQTGTSELPAEPGLVVRRINSTSAAAGSVVARGDLMKLERDGFNGGLRISYPAAVGTNLMIAAMGVNNAGASVNFFTTVSSPGVAGTVQIYTDAQNIQFAHISFGNAFANGHMTEVSLSRHVSDNFWVGTVTSTFNQ